MENIEKIIEFNLFKIITEQFALIPGSFEEGKEVKLKPELNFGIDKQNKRIMVSMLFRFEQENKPFIILKVACYFTIAPNDWAQFGKYDFNTVVIPQGFATHLAMLTIGTLRGVLHAKTENTTFNRFIIPTFNVTGLIKSDVIFNE
ncbi:hypothetical protein [Runella sp.]|uniref:hypothetical protein n=1 Tax=Runella sp. TaxID=1960881 RepID=UPI003D0EF7B3